MHFDFEKIVSDDKCLLGYLYEFCQRPLCSPYYNKTELKEYDVIFGEMIRRYNGDAYSRDEVKRYLRGSEYQGNLYRIISSVYTDKMYDDGEYERIIPKIDWNGLASSWSKSYDFSNFNKVNPYLDYTFIYANTGSSIGIDVNKMFEYFDYDNITSNENEVIFPMDEKYVIKVYRKIKPQQFKEVMDNIIKRL